MRFNPRLAAAALCALILALLALASYAYYDSRLPESSNSTKLTANTANEKVFIAANLFNSEHIFDQWSEALLNTVHSIGVKNAYVSIFENDSKDATPRLLQELKSRLPCSSTIVTSTIKEHQVRQFQSYEAHNTSYTKRTDYLAYVRNAAIEPLHMLGDKTEYKKILFLNDIIYTATEATALLFETNGGNYSAACALDFADSPFKFYDRFATRDFLGKIPGLPFYPFFRSGPSREQILRGERDIRVRSCWGGAVAFNAEPFINGMRFRGSGQVIYQDASECCLIHADLKGDSSTFINSAVRVAYDDKIFRKLAWARRHEHLLKWPQILLSSLANVFIEEDRLNEKSGGIVDTINYGVKTIFEAEDAGFCYRHGMMVIDWQRGGWRFIT